MTTFEKLSNLGLRLAPNPAVEQVQILVEGLGENGVEITIFDAQGRVVWQQMVEGAEMVEAMSAQQTQQSQLLNTSTFVAGVYFVTLRSEGKSVTKRLMVARL